MQKKSDFNKIRTTSRMLVLLIALIFVTACNNPLEQENQENQIKPIIVYTALPETQIDAYLKVFQSQYPDIQVNLVRESIAGLTQKILDERDNPQADVIWGLGVTNMLILEWEDLLKAYNPAGIERIDERFKDTAMPPNWVGINILLAVFCVNPEKIKELNLPAPQSLEDLLNPIYKDHILMANPLTTGTGYIIVSSILDTKGEIAGWEYLDKLHLNIAYYANSAATACELVGKGEYPIGLSSDSRATIEINAGHPVVPVFPAEGISWDMRANALVKKKIINPAAMTFLDWAISDEAMKAYAKDTALLSVDLDIPPPKGYPDNLSTLLMSLDFPWAAANNLHILTEWKERYGEKVEPEKSKN